MLKYMIFILCVCSLYLHLYSQDKPVVIVNAIIDADIIKLADSLYDNKEYANSLKYYDFYIYYHPKSINAIARRGDVKLNMDQYADALNDYNTVLQLDSTNYITWSNRSLVHLYLKDINSAMNDALKAIQLNPKYPFGYFHLGLCYSQNGDYDIGIEYYKKVIDIDSNFTRAYFNIGVNYLNSKKPADARSYLEKAKVLGHPRAEGLINQYCK